MNRVSFFSRIFRLKYIPFWPWPSLLGSLRSLKSNFGQNSHNNKALAFLDFGEFWSGPWPEPRPSWGPRSQTPTQKKPCFEHNLGQKKVFPLYLLSKWTFGGGAPYRSKRARGPNGTTRTPVKGSGRPAARPAGKPGLRPGVQTKIFPIF